MVNALTASITVATGPERGEHAFATYADMPLRARPPLEVSDMANQLRRYFLILRRQLLADKRLRLQRVHHTTASALVGRVAGPVPHHLTLDPVFPVPFMRFSCRLPCGLAAVLNLIGLRYYSMAQAIVNLWQRGEASLSEIGRLRQLNGILVNLMPRLGAGYVQHCI